jgi:hypothetical protein
MQLVDAKTHARVVHSNDPSNTIRKGKPVKDAVEAAFNTALFWMSEIAFHKNIALPLYDTLLVRFTVRPWFKTLIFEKVNGEWRKLRECGGWV